MNGFSFSWTLQNLEWFNDFQQWNFLVFAPLLGHMRKRDHKEGFVLAMVSNYLCRTSVRFLFRWFGMDVAVLVLWWMQYIKVRHLYNWRGWVFERNQECDEWRVKKRKWTNRIQFATSFLRPFCDLDSSPDQPQAQTWETTFEFGTLQVMRLNLYFWCTTWFKPYILQQCTIFSWSADSLRAKGTTS